MSNLNGEVQGSDYKLHKYAIEGKKGKLKAVLNKLNQNINTLDLNGNTALYYASINRHKACVKLLLDYCADPNERSSRGRTALHAAAQNGDIKIFNILLSKGADLRLHDDEGRTVKDYASIIQNVELKKNFLHALEITPSIPAPKMIGEYQQTSLCPSIGHCVPTQHAVNEYINLNLTKKTNETVSNVSINNIEECELTHDPLGLTSNNGAFMVYEAMKWKEKLLVTVKRLHLTPVDGAYVDLLIQEQNILSHISYPKIIQLIGVARSPVCDRQSLVFERVQFGSLFNILHETQGKGVKIRNLVEIISSICEAIIYLHEQRILHCYINSHSVLMVTAHTPKLANFEYAVPKSLDTSQQKRSKVTDNKHPNYAWNWIAPELMLNDLPHEKSDMYSFCAFIWELFNMTIPWRDMEWNEIKKKIHEEGECLPVDLNLIPFPFNRILKDGLSYNTIKRMSFEEVKSSLDNFRESIRSKTQLKMGKKNVYTNDVKNIKPKSGIIYTDYGIETINDTPVANEMATYNSEDFENRSQFSSKSIICCDAYKTEFHLTKSGLSVISKETRHKDRSNSKNNRAQSSQNDRSKRKHNTSETTKSPKSTDYHMESIGLLSVTPKNSRVPNQPTPPPPPPPPPPMPSNQQSHYENQFDLFYNNTSNIPQPPPPPPPLPPTQINISLSKSNKSSTKTNKKQRDSLFPQTLVDDPSSQSSRNTQQFINQSKFTSITDPASEFHMPSSFLTPTSTPKHDTVSSDKKSKSFRQQQQQQQQQPISSNQMIEELKTRNGSSNKLSQMTDQVDTAPQSSQSISKNKNTLQDVLQRQYRILEMQEKQQQQQQQQQQLQMQPNKQIDYDFNSATQQNPPNSSTPINIARTRQIFQRNQLNEFERDNNYRLSNNSYSGIGENLDQPIQDDKIRYFKNAEDHEQLHHQMNRNLSRKVMSESSDDEENKVVRDNQMPGSRNSSINETKKIYSNVRKSTIVAKNEEDQNGNNQSQNLASNLTNKSTGSSVSVAQLVNEHLSMSLASNNNISLNKPPAQDSQRKPVKLKQNQAPRQSQVNNLIRAGSYNRIDSDSTSNKAIFWELKSASKESLANDSNNKLQSDSQMNDFISKRSSSFSDSRSQMRHNSNGSHSKGQQHQSRFNKQYNEQNDSNNIQFCTNFGSVKNLVKSYEAYNDQSENEIKMRMIREARNKEIQDAVESSKAALAAQHHINEQLEKQKQDFIEEQQIDQNNNVVIKPEQVQKLHKELSTISERTEQSSSNKNNLNTNNNNSFDLPVKQNGTVNNLVNTNLQTSNGVASPPNPNLSNSKATTTTTSTKSIRNLNLPLYNENAFMNTTNTNLANMSNTSGLVSTPKSFNLTPKADSSLSNPTTSKHSIKTDKQQSNYYYSKGQFIKLESIHDSDQTDYYQILPKENKQLQLVGGSDDEETDNLNEHYSSRYLKSNHDTTRNSAIQDKIDRSNILNNSAKNRPNSKSNYSSQEDFLSSINNADISIEASESVFLTFFDKAKRGDTSMKKTSKNIEKGIEEEDEDEHIQEDQHFPSIPDMFMQPTKDNNEYASAALTPPPPPMPMTSNFNYNISNSKQTKQKNDSNMKNSFTNRPSKEAKEYSDSCSSTSLAVASSASSLSANNSTTTNSCKNSSNTNIRREEHYIDTNKYKGYQYKLETRSNETNLFHIESSLTNANTGHSLLLAKTRVQTPKISTKIIIDR